MCKLYAKSLFCLVLVLGLSGSVRAQQPAGQEGAPASESAAETERLKQQTRWEKLLAHLPQISGYIQLKYEAGGGVSDFTIKRARLSLRGGIGPKVDYRLQLDFASSPKIVDAFVQYKPFGALNLKAGQFKVPFSIENTDYTPQNLEGIEYSMPLRRLMGFSETLGDARLSASGRDMGALLYGGFGRRDGYFVLNYDLGVFNGSGINTSDKNTSKDLAARLTVKPAPGWMVSGSYYLGEYGDSYLKRERYGAGACFDRGKWVVRGEWLGGTTGALKSDGWYAMAGLRVHPKWMTVVRCEGFCADTANRTETTQTNYMAGINWQPLKPLRCQLNYTVEEFGAKGAGTHHKVALMLTAAF